MKPETVFIDFASTGRQFHADMVEGRKEFKYNDVRARKLEMLDEFLSDLLVT